MIERESRKCCVIGGAGFIGGHVTRMLAESGRDVTVLGRRGRSDVSLPADVRYVSCDYGSRDVLREILTGVDEVIALAYATVPQTSFADPVFDILSNLPASVGLMQAAAAEGVNKLVIVSSGGTVYGVAASLPIGEDHPTNPISPYGITKLTLEKYAEMFRIAYDLPVVVVRPGNAYGEEQRPFAGQGFVATAMHAILQGREISVFGAEGSIRDYLHVTDVARGIIAALEHGQSGHAYNVGSGIGRSNLEVLREIEPHAARAGHLLRVRSCAARTFDVPVNVLDSSKLQVVSGWRAAISFTSGIEQVWQAVLGNHRE